MLRRETVDVIRTGERLFEQRLSTGTLERTVFIRPDELRVGGRNGLYGGTPNSSLDHRVSFVLSCDFESRQKAGELLIES